MSNLGTSSSEEFTGADESSDGSDGGDGGDATFVADDGDESSDGDGGGSSSSDSSGGGGGGGGRSTGVKRPASGGATSAAKRQKGSDGKAVNNRAGDSDDSWVGDDSSGGSSGGSPGGSPSPSVSSDSSESEAESGTNVDPEQAVEDAVRQFVAVAAQWARDNDDRVDLAFASDGGWELWLEVELFLALHAEGAQVSRQFPYNSASPLRADLLLSDTVIVELKAQTGKETAEQFRRRVASDSAKVDKQAGKLPAVVVAFAYEATGVGGLVTDFTSEGIQAGSLRIFYEASTLS